MELISNNIHDFWVAHFDPFYLYCAYGALAVLAATAASWYFPVLRSLAGAVVFGVIASLFGFRKGEQAEQTREAAREDEKKNSSSWTWGK